MNSPPVAVRDIYRGWMSLLVATLRLPNGEHVERHIMLNGRAVCVLPYDPERRTALVVSMLRAPVTYVDEPDMLECIAGTLDEDDPADCARRETLEEVGVELGALEHLGRIWSMPSNSTEQIDYYLAPYRDEDRRGEGGGSDEEQERTTVYELPLVELWRKVERNELRDGKLLILLQALRIRRPILCE